MKISVFLFFVTVFQVFAINNYAQTKKLSLSVEKSTIADVLQAIEDQSEFKFFYNNELVDVSKEVSIEAKRKNIWEVLDQVLPEAGITYRVVGKQVALFNADRPAGEKSVMQQPVKITGKVTDEQGNPLPGANIIVKGTSVGTTSDVNGDYSLELPPDATAIVVSFIGYTSREVPLDGKRIINVQLSMEVSKLDEIVVTGYTTEKKSDLTGAVAVVKVDEITSQPVSGVDKMLQGRVAGVDVLGSGAPGGGTAIRIRGYSTIRNDDPLYIIDGVPTTGGIDLLNPNDIESIQILKDASSATIYGSRAANGVIIITTKKGNKDNPGISFNAYVGVQNAINLPRMLSAQEYGDAYWQASKNDGITNVTHDIYGSGPTPTIPEFINTDGQQTIPSANTDWVAEIFQPAMVQSYDLSVAQGSEKKHSLYSVGYFDQQGVILHTDFKRFTARLNSDYMLFGKVKIGENLSASYSGSTKTTTNSALGSVVYDAYRMMSIAPVYDINGDFTGYPLSDIQNPVGKLYRNKDNVQKEFKLFGNTYLQYEIVKGLVFKSNVGLDFSTYNFDNFSPTFKEPDAQRNTNTLNVTNRNSFNWVWTNTLNYVHTFGEKHHLNVLLGSEAIENYMEYVTAYRKDIPLNDINSRVLNFGDGGSQQNSGNKFESSLLSYFGKVNYSFDNKYLFSATLRRDGTSKLKNYKWGTFPAFSAAWRISKESFFNWDFVSNLKLRFGWGQTGNQDIPAYVTELGYISDPYYSNYAIDGSQNSVYRGFTLSKNTNPDLKWETTTQTNFGLDMGFLENRISLTADYFIKNTEDLLFERKLPPLIGGTNQTIWDNVGSMRNRGFEFNLSYKNDHTRQFKYTVGLNMGFIRNELTSLMEGIDFIGINPAKLHSVNFDQETSRTVVGEPIASFYGYTVDGIFQSQAEADEYTAQPNAVAGDFKFRDLNGDGVIDNADKSIIGSPHPDFTYSISFNSQYKNFDFFLFFIGSQGNEIYDLSRYYGDFFNLANYNKSQRTLDAWTPDHTNTDVPRLSLNDLNNNIRPSSYYVQDASYFKLKTLQIGYSLPQKVATKMRAERFRIYFEATNLFTITPYDGLDPEVGLQNYDSDDRNLDIGVDRGIYPQSQTFTFGINLDF